MSDEQEKVALTSTLSAFYHFHEWQRNQLLEPTHQKFKSLTKQDQNLLPWFTRHLEDLELCILMNQQFTQRLALAVAPDWGCSPDPFTWLPAQPCDFDRVSSTLLQLTREWSADGSSERESSYSGIIDELCSRFVVFSERQNIKILVPGCGTGRLVWELVCKGFSCQGNEFSYHMLFAANFILNHCPYPHCCSIFPYLMSSLHIEKRAYQLRPITIPDANPTTIHVLSNEFHDIPFQELMSITAGSFTDIYGPIDDTNQKIQSENDTGDKSDNIEAFRQSCAPQFDVVCTVYFVDTASNFIKYMRTILNCMKPGGLWINFGPLLWHFEHVVNQNASDPTPNGGIELTRDDLWELIIAMGFVFQERKSGICCTYTSDPKALGKFEYKCEWWICKV